MDAMIMAVETLTSAREVESPLVPLASVLRVRQRPDLEGSALDELVFLTMGATASLCLRIALLRPENSDRENLISTGARMLLAAFDLASSVSGGRVSH